MKHFKLRWILFTAFAAVLCWTWWHFRGLPVGPVSPWAALPADVPAVLEYPDFQAAFRADSNALAADFAIAASLEEESRLLGRVLQIWSPQLKKSPLTAGLHPVGNGKISFSLLLDLRGHAPDADQLMRSPEIRRVIPSVYRGHKIYTVYLKDREAVFAFAVHRNLLIVAALPLLVEEAIGRLDWRPGSLARLRDFKAIRGDRPAAKITRVYLQTGQLHQLLAGLLHPAGLAEVQRWKTLSNWLRLDLQRQKGRLLLSGLSGIPPQAPIHDALLERAQILQPKHLEVIPDNLALLWVGSISNWNRMSDEGGREFKKYISSWAGRELAVAMAQPKGVDLPSDWYAAIAVRQKDLAERRLSELAAKAGTLQDYDYQSFQIRQVMTDQLLPFFPARRMENPFFAFVGDDVVFASSQAGMEVWIDAFIAGKTLARDERFLPLYEQGKRPGAWFLYLPAGQLQPLVQAYAPQAPGMARLLQSLGDIALAASAKGRHWQLQGMAAPTAPAGTQQSAVAWKSLLPAPAASAPYPVADSAAGQVCIAVQDSAFRLHFIGPAGELRWSKTLDGPLLSTVQTMDYYGDGSTALLFNTARNVYLTDMQGKELGNFPLPLQSPATNGVTVVNFDEGLQICFFIACANGNVYGFDRLGRPLPGWNPMSGAGTLRFPLLHFYKEDKDYLLTLNDKGVLRAYRRDGGERLPPRALEGMFLSGPAYQVSEKSNRVVAMNAAGTVHVIGLKGEYFKLACPVGTGQSARLAFGAMTGDERNDYAVASGGELALYAYRDNSKFEQVFSRKFDAPLDEVFCVRFPGEGSDRIGAVSRSAGKIYLLDAAGELYPGFPLAGHTPFFVADLYRNGRPMVVCAYGDSVYAYQVGR